MNASITSQRESVTEFRRRTTPGLADSKLEPRISMDLPAWNSQTVEFIAKPGMAENLRDCILGPVTEFLNRQPGFSLLIALSSRREPRRMLVLTLWATDDETGGRWETTTIIQKAIAPLIDLSSSVQTYEGTMARSLDDTTQAEMTRIC